MKPFNERVRKSIILIVLVLALSAVLVPGGISLIETVNGEMSIDQLNIEQAYLLAY